MVQVTRRSFSLGLTSGVLAGVSAFLAPSLRLGPAEAQVKQNAHQLSVEEWMDGWMKGARAPEGTLHLSRFKEPVYFLLKPISWTPDPGQTGKLEAISVPTGFVTDFASVPRPFWSLLPPDGDYTYPAIVHDYMYWMQTWPREAADETLRLGMREFGIDRNIVFIIFEAVRKFGGASWKTNKKLKEQGEKRILKEFPSDPRVSWEDWKRRPEVFI
jgi:hypothetical protein